MHAGLSRALSLARVNNNEGHMVGLFPERKLFDMVLLSKMKPVIRPENDNRVFPMPASIKGTDQPAHRTVGETAASSIGSDKVAIGSFLLTLHFHHAIPEPLLRPHQPRGTGGQVSPVILLAFWQGNLLIVKVVVFHRRKKR
ncbi:hypothetical protein N9146_02980 [Akkermansiaceae bacterium]|nr:hypothetical protein [Akkermansiaceae bacterium]